MKHFNIKYEIRHRIGDTRDFKTITNNKLVEAGRGARQASIL